MNALSTILDYLDILLSRKWLIIGFVLLGLGAAATLCYVLPKEYRSSTVIVVEDQRIPDRYVQGMVIGSASDRLNLIQQHVTSRTMLEAMIKKYQLYPEATDSTGLETAIARMRKNIRVETKGGGQMQLFTISFVHERPETAQAVVTALTNQFIQDQVRIREEFVRSATEFIDQQLESARKSLEEKEKTISAFKLRHMGELPGQLETNLRTLDRLQKELADVNEALQKSTDRKLAIQKALNSYQAMQGPLEQELREQVGAVRPVPVAGRPNGGTDPGVARLRELERQLEALSAVFKDSYPDVVQTKQEIARLKAFLASKEKEEKTAEAGHADALQDAKDARKPKPASRQTVDPFVQELTAQRYEAELTIASLVERKKQLMAQVREYETRVEKAPVVEQEMSALLRDYQNMEKNYQSLHEKKLSAQIAEEMEKRRKGEQFRMLDPANLPQFPEKPEVLKIMLLGLLGGCGIGVGTAVMIENANPVFRRQSDAEMLLGLPVLAGIPSFSSIYRDIGNIGRGFWAGKSREQKAIAYQHEAKKNAQKPTALTSALRPSSYGAPRDAAHGLFSQQDTLPPVLNLVSKWRPASLIAEQYRVAATRLALMALSQPGTTVVVTSSVTGEGKSVTSINLAYVLANDLQKRTLIIDCDLKNPTVNRYLGMELSVGLSDVLSGGCPIEQAVRQVEGASLLWFLSSGGRLSLELAAVGKLNQILPGLKHQFDFIIIDAPPILPLADMNVIAAVADLLVMVIRAGVTGTAVVQRALRNLSPNCKVGVVLTNIQSAKTPYYMKAYAEYAPVKSVKERTA
jgi:polysaccharide chain length determinant protein (PEP-CTERM system associated)